MKRLASIAAGLAVAAIPLLGSGAAMAADAHPNSPTDPELTAVISYQSAMIVSPVPYGFQYTIEDTSGITNGVPLTGIAMTASFPPEVYAAPAADQYPVSANTCGGTLSINALKVTLSGGTMPLGANCTFFVAVIAGLSGHYLIPSSGPTSDPTGPGNQPTASVDVYAAGPGMAKFNPGSIIAGQASQLNFSIANPAANPIAFTGTAINVTLPAGLAVATGSSAVCGGSLIRIAPASIVVREAHIASGGTCTFSVAIVGKTVGHYVVTAELKELGHTAGQPAATLDVLAPAKPKPAVTASPAASVAATDTAAPSETASGSATDSAAPSDVASATATATDAGASAGSSPASGTSGGSAGGGAGVLPIVIVGIGVLALLGGLLGWLFLRRA